MQVTLDSRFARPSSAPIRGEKKGEFRDWTIGREETGDKRSCESRQGFDTDTVQQQIVVFV